MNWNRSTKVFLEISFRWEHIWKETTQLIYTLNQVIGFYIAFVEIGISHKILFL